MADVRFENITFHYGDKCILKNFSLSVEESQIMCLVGPSGCGKTTLVRCLLGFIKPETGSIYVGDKCLFSAEKKINVPPEYRHIGVVFQDYAVWPHMTVLENILYPMKKMRMNKVEMTEKARHALEQVRMVGYEKHLPSQLSGGQQQRVAIARALVSSDDVIVMDEPITNLDAKLREETLERRFCILPTIRKRLSNSAIKWQLWTGKGIFARLGMMRILSLRRQTVLSLSSLVFPISCR
mgnify:CR=1 FL=1